MKLPSLDAVVVGCVVRLSLDDEQHRALRDRDGTLALHVLRHSLAAGLEPGAPQEPFPLVPRLIQAVGCNSMATVVPREQS
jgi:hypothetical protein